MKFNYGLFGLPRLSRFWLFFDMLLSGPGCSDRHKADNEPIIAGDFGDS